MYTVDQIVLDLVSRRLATIVSVDRAEEASECVTLDTSIPLDPTGDGAFPTRGRNLTEIVPLTENQLSVLVEFDY